MPTSISILRPAVIIPNLNELCAYNFPIRSNAKDALNFTHVNGMPIRIMFSHRDPSLQKSGYANLFIKNLDQAIDTKALFETFSAFGTVLSCKITVDHNENSRSYGFV
ncbi:hypothetical protein SASPL_143102 [Salvia splendens]|uniref:RRM domain-containing protein n=1 Tax=Salvia splendens TaxID=180675 RepID=A0A8X8ZA04_SALSN|nr:hypothetical protein SASPL_143102 [Salvia splendens]